MRKNIGGLFLFFSSSSSFFSFSFPSDAAPFRGSCPRFRMRAQERYGEREIFCKRKRERENSKVGGNENVFFFLSFFFFTLSFELKFATTQPSDRKTNLGFFPRVPVSFSLFFPLFDPSSDSRKPRCVLGEGSREKKKKPALSKAKRWEKPGRKSVSTMAMRASETNEFSVPFVVCFAFLFFFA